MSIADLRNVIRKKNLDRTFTEIVNYLEDNGGNSNSGVQNSVFEKGFNGILEINSSIINISVSESSSEDATVYLAMPLGRNSFDRVLIYFASDDSSGVDLFIGNYGYTISDPTKTYNFLNVRVGINGWLEMQWDDSRGWWVIINQYNCDLPEFIPGITCYNLNFTSSYRSDFISINKTDLFIEITEDLSTNQIMELLLQAPSYSGIRARFEINFNNSPRSLRINAPLVSGGDEATAIDFGLSGYLLLEWSMSLNAWIVIDMPSHATLVI